MKKRILLLASAIVVVSSSVLADDAASATGKTNKLNSMNNTSSTMVSVRYMIDDVDAAVAFYTNHLGFALEQDAAPAFASVTRGNLRLLLSGPKSSGRRAMPDGTRPVPGGWNRIELSVTNIEAEAARLRSEGVKFHRNDVVSGPGGSQIWIEDPSGNLIELFQPKE